MADLCSLRCLAMIAAAVAASPLALAQVQSSIDPMLGGGGFNLQRNASAAPVGFNIARAEYRLPCGITVLQCRTTNLGEQHSRTWSLELGLANLGSSSAAPWRSQRAQAVSLSLLGKRPVFGLQQLNVYGKVGTAYGFTEPSSAALASNGEGAFGLAYGAGLSFDFSPRLSATLGWDSRDFRDSSGLRDVRATSLGLEFRY